MDFSASSLLSDYDNLNVKDQHDLFLFLLLSTMQLENKCVGFDFMEMFSHIPECHYKNDCVLTYIMKQSSVFADSSSYRNSWVGMLSGDLLCIHPSIKKCFKMTCFGHSVLSRPSCFQA